MIKNELGEKRKKIDEIDQKLVFLIEERMKIVKEIGMIKKREKLSVLDEEREKEVLASRERMVENSTIQKHIKCIFVEIMAQSRKIQEGKDIDV